ncbi:MAG: peptide-methionine (S)-S-oxide reductase MsrA [Acidobacteriota bacterium]|nr:peptide-methionine (S)-S-oxide reductase MsrA [Acidobacteriota bacterium]
MEEATFGAGCFWGVEAAFRKLNGVKSTAVGYSGGDFEDPTYQDVCSGQTGHAEVVRVQYNAAHTSYNALLDLFWKIHDPTTLNRQNFDIGTQYRSAVFFHTPEQQILAKTSKGKLESSGQHSNPIVTEITPISIFYMAEDYHQQYFEKNGIGHCS